MITKLDFNFCYWIPGKKLCDFVKQCPNLKDLSVAHSTVSNKDLAEILAGNEKISMLSFSIESQDAFWIENEIQNSKATVSVDPPLGSPLSISHFGKCEKTLGELESLEIYTGQYPVILGTVLRYNNQSYSTVESCFNPIFLIV